jgi:hypothetical protein
MVLKSTSNFLTGREQRPSGTSKAHDGRYCETVASGVAWTTIMVGVSQVFGGDEPAERRFSINCLICPSRTGSKGVIFP